MDGTKTADFKTSLTVTVTQVLDDKLPMVISRACVSDRMRDLLVANLADTRVYQDQMDAFHISSSLRWAIEVFFGCHILCVVIVYARVWKPWWKDQAARTASRDLKGDSHCMLTDVAFLDSIACGLTMGYDIAVLLNVLLHISNFTASASRNYDPFDLLIIQGLLFSLLLVIGALASASWPAEHIAIHHPQCQDVELGLP